MEQEKKLVDFFETIGKLKKIRRTGWVKSGVRNAESVAEHTLRIAVMALFLAKKTGCDQEKLVKMALVHDLHESICGDLTLDYTKYGAAAGLPPQEKDRLELEGMKKFVKLLEADDAKEFRALWMEAEEKKTREAKVLHELDKLELLLQASEYHREKNGRSDLFPLFNLVNEKFVQTPLLRKMLGEVRARTQ